LEEIGTPACSAGEALVRVRAAGICGTDMAIYAGKHPRAMAPLTMGHEFAGEIAALKPGSADAGLAVGDAVTAYPLLTCGACWACRHDAAHVCRDLRLVGIDRDGAFAEYVTVPMDCLVKLPAGLSAVQGALIEPLAVGVHALSMAGDPPWRHAVVVGSGPIGLMVAHCLQQTGTEAITVSDINAHRLKRAERLQCDVFNSEEGDLAAHVTRRTDGEGADIVFECSGAAPAALQMVDLVRPRGRIVMVGVHKEPHAVDLRGVCFKEISLVGSRVYTFEDYRRAVAMIGALPCEVLVSHRLPLADGRRGFDLMRQADGVCKVLLTMD
jgi:2-desacetyl-2-hydroxyethyl bacteriochlorophyllide A dehydrogenase